MERTVGAQGSGILRETLESIKNAAGPAIRDLTVERAVVGLFFTGVKLSNGFGGVSFTPIKDIPEAVCCPSSAKTMPSPGRLRGRNALGFAEQSLQRSPIQRALGIASLNALSNAHWARVAPTGYSLEPGLDPIDALCLPKGAFVVVVGALVPYLRLLKKRGEPFCVLEKDPATLKRDELQFYAPAERAADMIPRADILIATGTTQINGTLDGLLAFARPGAEIVVVGPTASMLPEAFFRRGVRIVGGVRVNDADALLDVLSEGGSGYHFFGTTAEKVAMIAEPAIVETMH